MSAPTTTNWKLVYTRLMKLISPPYRYTLTEACKMIEVDKNTLYRNITRLQRTNLRIARIMTSNSPPSYFEITNEHYITDLEKYFENIRENN
jgi:hypothetical protein